MFSSLVSSAINRSVASASFVPRRFFHASPLAWAKLNVEGLAEKVDLSGQNVLVRVDLNVPLAEASYLLTCLFIYLFSHPFIHSLFFVVWDDDI
jgi:hypothetical protein